MGVCASAKQSVQSVSPTARKPRHFARIHAGFCDESFDAPYEAPNRCTSQPPGTAPAPRTWPGTLEMHHPSCRGDHPHPLYPCGYPLDHRQRSNQASTARPHVPHPIAIVFKDNDKDARDGVGSPPSSTCRTSARAKICPTCAEPGRPATTMVLLFRKTIERRYRATNAAPPPSTPFNPCFPRARKPRHFPRIPAASRRRSVLLRLVAGCSTAAIDVRRLTLARRRHPARRLG